MAYARKKGVLTCKGDIIVFCDDDNWLENNYLAIALDFMTKNHNVGAVGGDDIGIGTDAPTEKLHVEGNIYSSGTITASNLTIRYIGRYYR